MSDLATGQAGGGPARPTSSSSVSGDCTSPKCSGPEAELGPDRHPAPDLPAGAACSEPTPTTDCAAVSNFFCWEPVRGAGPPHPTDFGADPLAPPCGSDFDSDGDVGHIRWDVLTATVTPPLDGVQSGFLPLSDSDSSAPAAPIDPGSDHGLDGIGDRNTNVPDDDIAPYSPDSQAECDAFSRCCLPPAICTVRAAERRPPPSILVDDGVCDEFGPTARPAADADAAAVTESDGEWSFPETDPRQSLAYRKISQLRPPRGQQRPVGRDRRHHDHRHQPQQQSDSLEDDDGAVGWGEGGRRRSAG